MKTEKIISLLREKEVKYSEISVFSKLPGIYAIFFIGNNFPIIGNEIKKHQIIYIGKTESSQEKRDAKTHFSTGKTGSSTVRKSIGALLHELEHLIPISRNLTDYEKGRFSHFKFDNESEKIITSWMNKNLALSFYEYPRTKQEIENLESNIIDELVPVLNISKNLKNPHIKLLQSERKNCASIAYSNFNNRIISITTKKQTNIYNRNSNMNTSGKYIDLWTKKRSEIFKRMNLASPKELLQLNSEEFENVGKRKSYSFNLQFENGKVCNNIEGSAVARDLVNVMVNSPEIMKLINSNSYNIKLDKDFCLLIQKK